MGAWGPGTFDNDTAADWAGDFADTPDLEMITAAFDAVRDDYLDGDVACEALAACEVIARLRGHWGTRNAYSEGLDRWVEANPRQPEQKLVDRALVVIDRITAESSELAELWADDPAWAAAVADLRRRVAA